MSSGAPFLTKEKIGALAESHAFGILLKHFPKAPNALIGKHSPL
jgi:hypothetical protein